MARGQVHDPHEYALSLVGHNLTERRVIFRGLSADPRGINGDPLTLRELCLLAPFPVYGMEMEAPIPAPDAPAPRQEAAANGAAAGNGAAAWNGAGISSPISVSSEDEAAGVPRPRSPAAAGPPSPPAAGPPSPPAAGPPSPPVFGAGRSGPWAMPKEQPRVGQVYAAKARLVSRSPSPQVCVGSSVFLSSRQHARLTPVLCRLPAPCATPRPSGLCRRATCAALPFSACRRARTSAPQTGRPALPRRCPA